MVVQNPALLKATIISKDITPNLISGFLFMMLVHDIVGTSETTRF